MLFNYFYFLLLFFYYFSIRIVKSATMVGTYPVMDKYECGSGDFQNLIALNVNCLFCGPIGVAYFNECCKKHDYCYNQQMGKLNCDIQFCCCLTDVSMRLQNPYLLCPLNAQSFCNLLNTPAAWDAYNRAGQPRRYSMMIK